MIQPRLETWVRLRQAQEDGRAGWLLGQVQDVDAPHLRDATAAGAVGGGGRAQAASTWVRGRWLLASGREAEALHRHGWDTRGLFEALFWLTFAVK